MDGIQYGRGTGETKKSAQEEAARQVLRRLRYEEVRSLVDRRVNTSPDSGKI